jgi:hypothetical protein
MEKLQINVRLSQEQINAIDSKRITLQQALGKIPNRSDILRFALDAYLATQALDGPTTNADEPKSRKKD